MLDTGSKTGDGQGGGGSKKGSNYLKISKYAAAGLEFPSTVLGGMFLGYLLDSYFNASPWFTTILTFVGLVGAFVRLFQWVSYFSREKNDD
jgi:F0F1-type ATP synthase assembly protein I